ncbi:MAG: ABC transporter permease [Planctomycetota bacterium]|nr:ABC transporter permease [Planctomycetota bacterium]
MNEGSTSQPSAAGVEARRRSSATATPTWLAWARAPEWGLVAGILAALAFIYFLGPREAFFDPFSRVTLLHNIALYGVISVGAAIVIIAGGIDLSTGSVVALSSIFCGKLLTSWLRGGAPASTPPSVAIVVLAIALTLLLGLAIGLMHSVMINYLRLPPFIATLATMAGLRSVATVVASNHQITLAYPAFRMLGKEMTWSLAIFAAVAAAASFMMGMTVLGRHLYALGGNEAAARLSGLSVKKLKAVAYGLSGMLSALAGVLFAGKTGQGDHRMGMAYELYAITAAVVGGCSLSGGVGSIRGTVLGLILIQIVIKGVGTFQWQGVDSTSIEGIVLGTVIVLAVAINQRFRGKN